MTGVVFRMTQAEIAGIHLTGLWALEQLERLALDQPMTILWEQHQVSASASEAYLWGP